MTGNAWDAAAYDSRFGFVSHHGDDLLELLAPSPGEAILDLGCGTGRHAGILHARGAGVVGMDADEDMLAAARLAHPHVPFVRADAVSFGLADLGVDRPFDACVSNAALHWMTPQKAVLRNVRAVLGEGARFVAEMGGAGNIARLDASLRAALEDLGLGGAPVVTNYFPTVAEQSVALESAGFRVEYMRWFRRPTPLGPGTTAADWTRHFRATTWASVPGGRHAELAAAVDAQAAERGLHDADGWTADYCRLRFVAIAS